MCVFDMGTTLPTGRNAGTGCVRGYKVYMWALLFLKRVAQDQKWLFLED
jgi:hypothetical protein